EQLDRIGAETAGPVRAASALAPRAGELCHPMVAVPVRRLVVGPPPVRTELTTLLTVAAAAHPDATLKRRLGHDDLRDNPAAWEAGIEGLLRRLRRLGLDQLSPRLKQHLFEGHYSARKNRNLGYHHRAGGVDSGALRVVRMVGRPDRHGVYRAEVAGPRTGPRAPVKRSTFFPDAWTRDIVLRAIRHAFVNRSDLDPARLRWRGRFAGVVIEGVVERTILPANAETRTARLYHIVTAYPVYQGKEAGGQSD
ncbi:EndoU domain-containing protein, partial [Actinophytocola sp.]|uniref:EndoU domain-containing protein n=1 Tax=Actinophytocola sp. TaxID=1872138 RepID=UPI002D7FC5B3